MTTGDPEDQVNMLEYYTQRLQELQQLLAEQKIGDMEFAEEYGKALVLQSRLVRQKC